MFLAQHLLSLPKSGQGLLGAGSSSAFRRASPFKELAQLAHGCGFEGRASRQWLRSSPPGRAGGTGKRGRPLLSGGPEPKRRRSWESTSRRGQVTQTPGHFLAAASAPPLGAAGAGRALESDVPVRAGATRPSGSSRRAGERGGKICCLIHTEDTPRVDGLTSLRMAQRRANQFSGGVSCEA